jgi:osmotically-inducible protein OsmY
MNRKLSVLVVLVLVLSVLAAACGKKDMDIQKAVQDKLTADGVTGVTATVKDGVATLSGEVKDITVKSKAEASAKTVDGVKSVDSSKLTTAPLPVATPSAGDQALKGKIEENWKKAGCVGATVDVKDGVATVNGTVPDAKYATCIQVVSESGAVKPVYNLQKSK